MDAGTNGPLNQDAAHRINSHAAAPWKVSITSRGHDVVEVVDRLRRPLLVLVFLLLLMLAEPLPLQALLSACDTGTTTSVSAAAASAAAAADDVSPCIVGGRGGTCRTFVCCRDLKVANMPYRRKQSTQQLHFTPNTAVESWCWVGIQAPEL